MVRMNDEKLDAQLLCKSKELLVPLQQAENENPGYVIKLNSTMNNVGHVGNPLLVAKYQNQIGFSR